MDRDDLLVLKMRGGDEKALETFVEKYYPAILRYCRLHIDDYGYAEDMAQETFDRFFRTLRQYRHYGKAANYLYAIAANACRDYYRQSKNRELPTEQLPDQLLQTGAALNMFNLYSIGGRVVGAVPILLTVYTLLTVCLWPIIYEVYRHKQIG